MSYPKLTPIIAEGATEPIYLNDRFGEIATIKDFGAKCDGITDDAAAVTAANTFGKKVNYCGETVKTSVWPNTESAFNGYVEYEGKITNLDGAKAVTTSHPVQKLICKIPIFNDQGGRRFTHSTWAAQGIAWCRVNGIDKIFMATRSTHPDNYYAYQTCTISEWNLDEENQTATMISRSADLSIGHGQGMGVQVVNNEVYLYAMETGVPNRYKCNGANFAKGFTRIHWRGSSTTNSDIVSYRLMDFYKANNNAEWSDNANVCVCTPNISPDGTKILLMGGGEIAIYDLASILACTTADVDYTWANANTGESAPLPDDPYVPVQTRINASSIKPLYRIAIDQNKTRSQQGLACDSKYIYVSSGAGGIPSSSPGIDIYDWLGNKVKTVLFPGGRALYTRSQLLGNDSSLGVMVYNENEGMFVMNDKLCLLMQVRWRPAGDIVTCNGRNYACISSHSSNANIYPDSFSDGYWTPTTKSATKGTWSNSASYTDGSASYVENANQELRLIVSILEKTGDENEVDLYKGSFRYKYNNSINSQSFYTAKGNNFAFSFFNPYTGDVTNKLYFNDRNFYLYDSNGQNGAINLFTTCPGEGSRNYGKISVVDPVGNSSAIRFYPKTDTVNPGGLDFVTDSSSILLSLKETDGLCLRAGSSVGSAVGTKFFDLDNIVASCWASDSVFYIHGINRSVAIRRSTSDDGVGLYTGSFKPYTTDTTDLGSSSSRFKELYISGQIHAGNGEIDTSDERKKTEIEDIDTELLNAWSKVNFKIFKMKDAVAKKGTNARLHVGIVAQDIQKAFALKGINAENYGLFCYDEWESQEAVYDEENNEIERAVEAGNEYGIRYDEALALECAYLRSRITQMQEQINALIETVNQLTNN